MNIGTLFFIAWKQLSTDIPEWAYCKYGMVCWKCHIEAEYKYGFTLAEGATLEQVLDRYNI